MFFVCITTYSQNQNHTLQICRLNTMETLHTTYLYNELRKLDFTFEINCSLFYADVLQECTYKKQLCIFGSNVFKAINSQNYRQVLHTYLQKCKKEFLRIRTVFKRWQSRWWLHTQVILKTRT